MSAHEQPRDPGSEETTNSATLAIAWIERCMTALAAQLAAAGPDNDAWYAGEEKYRELEAAHVALTGGDVELLGNPASYNDLIADFAAREQAAREDEARLHADAQVVFALGD